MSVTSVFRHLPHLGRSVRETQFVSHTLAFWHSAVLSTIAWGTNGPVGAPIAVSKVIAASPPSSTVLATPSLSCPWKAVMLALVFVVCPIIVIAVRSSSVKSYRRVLPPEPVTLRKLHVNLAQRLDQLVAPACSLVVSLPFGRSIRAVIYGLVIRESLPHMFSPFVPVSFHPRGWVANTFALIIASATFAPVFFRRCLTLAFAFKTTTRNQDSATIPVSTSEKYIPDVDAMSTAIEDIPVPFAVSTSGGLLPVVKAYSADVITLEADDAQLVDILSEPEYEVIDANIVEEANDVEVNGLADLPFYDEDDVFFFRETLSDDVDRKDFVIDPVDHIDINKLEEFPPRGEDDASITQFDVNEEPHDVEPAPSPVKPSNSCKSVTSSSSFTLATLTPTSDDDDLFLAPLVPGGGIEPYHWETFNDTQIAGHMIEAMLASSGSNASLSSAALGGVYSSPSPPMTITELAMVSSTASMASFWSTADAEDAALLRQCNPDDDNLLDVCLETEFDMAGIGREPLHDVGNTSIESFGLSPSISMELDEIFPDTAWREDDSILKDVAFPEEEDKEEDWEMTEDMKTFAVNRKHEYDGRQAAVKGKLSVILENSSSSGTENRAATSISRLPSLGSSSSLQHPVSQAPQLPSPSSFTHSIITSPKKTPPTKKPASRPRPSILSLTSVPTAARGMGSWR
ncbi:hypothetical protein H0H87_000778 [Tephrocybe sp. NHM501043]|nr:hypothetical protein H0H87_000778 [Tephrocybe sp. NHM501043]